MKKGKKWILLFITLVLAAGLAACGSVQGSDKSSGEGGVEFSQGVTDKEILIGHSGPQTGPLAVYDAFRKGMDAYFQYVNDNGGVEGRKLKLIAYDDQYQPSKATQNAKLLVETDKVFMIVGNMGTASLQASKDIYVNSGIPVLMAGTGISEFVNPPIKNWFGSSMMNYEVEAKILLHYAVEELGAKKVAVAYQNDDFGKSSFESLKESLSDYDGVELVAEVTYLPTDTDFSSQAKKLQEANPDTVFNFGVLGPSANLKKAIHKIGMSDVNYVVTSVSGTDVRVFDLAGKDVWDGTYSAGTRIQMDDMSNEINKVFHEQFKKYYPNEEVTGQVHAGWGTGQIVVEALKRTNGEFTWDKLIEALETFDGWDGSVFNSITFNENNHYGLTKMYITHAKDGSIERITDLIEYNVETGEITLP